MRPERSGDRVDREIAVATWIVLEILNQIDRRQIRVIGDRWNVTGTINQVIQRGQVVVGVGLARVHAVLVEHGNTGALVGFSGVIQIVPRNNDGVLVETNGRKI